MLTKTIKGKVSMEPDLKVTQNGKPYTTFKLDIQGYNQELGIPETVTAFVKTWNDVAENVLEYVHKGMELSCVGRWETRDYTDKSGESRKWTEFIAFEIRHNDVPLNNLGFRKSEATENPDADLTPGFDVEAPPEVTSESR